MTIGEFLDSNPQHTYGYAAGYVSGVAAAEIGDQFAGLSRDEWLTATDDYAHGYRVAWQAKVQS
jgi:hypothetical protein